MAANIRNKTKSRAPVNVGDLVLVPMGGSSEFKTRVVEDRGRLGLNGRRILRVETIGTLAPTEFEVAEDDVKILRRKRLPKKSHVSSKLSAVTAKH